RAEAAIGQALADELGIAVPVIVKSARQFRSVIAANPSPAVSDPSRLLVAFSSRQEETNALAALEPLLTRGESFCITPHAAYLHCTGGILESKAAAALLGKLGRGVTTRNWATVLKIADALSGLPRSGSCKPAPLRGQA
ncbi:MAG: DUF1697 domain-containing protein, partial [Candidatus Krumholzibacteriia bacterium]